MRFIVRGVLLDIEGTTSSISFVYDQMFPFVLRELDSFLAKHAADADVASAGDQIARDAGRESLAAWCVECGTSSGQQTAVEVRRLMAADEKATGLKQLQGLIWKSGFDSGELRAHVFADVPEAIESWRNDGLDIRIYSSGSVQAQKLFFGHTERGDMLSLFAGHYDTQTGPKKKASSYLTIAKEYELAADEILFVSDNTEELDAARQAGMPVVLCRRPGNPTPPPHEYPIIDDFSSLCLLVKE
jgi:enolase-phosphatase E1